MGALLDFLDALWGRVKARWQAQARADLAKGAELVKAAEQDKADLDKVLSSEPAQPVKP